MKKRVIVERGVGRRIAKLLDITPEMVSKSLNFGKDSRLARRVRHIALKDFGGVIVGGDKNE